MKFKKTLALWKKSYDQPKQHINKQRHYLANKGRSCQDIVFPIVMYGYESWTIKKAEHQRIDDAFELWCWRRLLRVSCTARRSNQSALMEISPEYSLEGLMLKLKLQYFGNLMWRTGFLEKTLMLERLKAGVEGYDRRWDDWMASPTRWTWVWESSKGWWWTGKPGLLQSMGSQRVEHNWATELNWIDFQYIWWINLVFLKHVSLRTLSPDCPFIERCPSMMVDIRLFFKFFYFEAIELDTHKCSHFICFWQIILSFLYSVCSFLVNKYLFPTQKWNLGLPHCRQTLYHLSHQGIPSLDINVSYWPTACMLSCFSGI